MTPDPYPYWLRVAREYASDVGSAGDLLHEALLGFGLAELPNPGDEEAARIFVGVMRNLARQQRRATRRRQRREGVSATASVAGGESPTSTPEPNLGPECLPRLTRAQRTLLGLLATGYTRAEIASALAISDAALRQRVAVLRRRLAVLPTGARSALARQWVDRGAERQLISDPAERARAIALAHRCGTLVSVDPDGHLVAIAG